MSEISGNIFRDTKSDKKREKKSDTSKEVSDNYVSYEEFMKTVKKTRILPYSYKKFPHFDERSPEQLIEDIEAGKKKVEIETEQTFDMHSGVLNVDKAEESNKHVSYEDFLRRVKKTRITPLSTESLPNFEMKPHEQIIIDGIGVKKKVKGDNKNLLVFKSKNDSEKIDKTSEKVENKTKKEPIKNSDVKVKEEKSKVEEEKRKETSKSSEEILEEKKKSKDINRERKEQKKVKEKESKKSEEIKEKKSKNIDTKNKRDISSEKKKISEPKKEKEKEIEKKKVTKEHLEKHKEIKDITNKINDLEKRRNNNNNLIDHSKKKLQEGIFNGIITREGYEKKFRELTKENAQIEKQLREFNDNSSHSERLNNEKLRTKKGEVLEKKITELKQKEKNEELKEQDQISKEKAKELKNLLSNQVKQEQKKQELNGSENISNKDNSDFKKVKNNEKIENKMTSETIEKRRDVNIKQEENKKETLTDKVSNEFLEPKKEFEQSYGYIYKATNTVNGKVYIGQTTRKKWEKRWKEHIKEAKDKSYSSTHLQNSIRKYGEKAFSIKKIDTANNQNELDGKEKDWIKKYNSMNPKKGYNMRDGGEGGKLRPEVKEKIKKSMEEKWKNPEHQRKVSNGVSKAMKKKRKHPEHRENISKGMKKKWKDKKYQKDQRKVRESPEFKEKHSTSMENKWKDPEYRENVSKGVEKRWKDKEYQEKQKKVRETPEFKEKMRKAAEKRWKDKEISNMKEFLTDIKNKILKKDLEKKNNITGPTINRKIKEILGPNGPKNYREAKQFLKDRDIDNILKILKTKKNKKKNKKKRLRHGSNM